MKRKVLFVLMVISTSVAAMAIEMTPTPEIVVTELSGEQWQVEAIGEEEVNLFKDDVKVSNPYIIELTEDEQNIIFKAYAQADGCLPSDWAYLELSVPAISYPVPVPFPPEVKMTVTEDSAIFEAYWDSYYYDEDDYTLLLFLDGVGVDNPCTLPRDDEDYTIEAVVDVYFFDSGYSDYCAKYDFIVPALGRIRFDMNGDREVNIADVNFLIDMVMGNKVNKVYDVNDDGDVNIADVNMIVDRILSGN